MHCCCPCWLTVCMAVSAHPALVSRCAMRTSCDISYGDKGGSTQAREGVDKGRTLVDLAEGAPAQEGAQLGQGGHPGA